MTACLPCLPPPPTSVCHYAISSIYTRETSTHWLVQSQYWQGRSSWLLIIYLLCRPTNPNEYKDWLAGSWKVLLPNYKIKFHSYFAALNYWVIPVSCVSKTTSQMLIYFPDEWKEFVNVWLLTFDFTYSPVCEGHVYSEWGTGKESGTDIDQVLICQAAGLGLGLGEWRAFCLA